MVKKVSLGLTAVTVATFMLFTPVASATQGSPAGNNGFVKINNELAPDTIPNNHPHVGCEFSVEFYNYEKGDYNADVKFELQNPTKDGRTLTVASGNLKPFIGSDAAGGGNDIDASEVYRLNFTGDAHPQQGYHVKLTINAPKSKGADKKHKVFWVQPCEDEKPGEENDKPGEVLGENTAPTPEILPVTGGGLATVAAAGLTTTGVAYAAHLRRTKRG